MSEKRPPRDIQECDKCDGSGIVPRNLDYRYPSKDQIAADVANETSAITVAVATMADALESCPLNDALKVYAAIELAFKYGKPKYVEEVFMELFYPHGGGSDE